MDPNINTYGRCLIDQCLYDHNNLLILNGRLHQDRGLGRYTFLSKLGCSAVDYFISSHAVINCTRDFAVLPPSEMSDHCPIYLQLALCHMQEQREESTAALLLDDLIERDSMPEQELNGEDKESSHYYHITANTVQSLVEHMTTEGAQSKLHSLLDQLAEDTDPDRMLTFLYEKCRSILDECLPKV